MTCAACADLPDRLEISNCDGDDEPLRTFPPGYTRLVSIPELEILNAKRCPQCGALFIYSYSVPGGSEDFQRTWRNEELVRVQRGDAPSRAEAARPVDGLASEGWRLDRKPQSN